MAAKGKKSTKKDSNRSTATKKNPKIAEEEEALAKLEAEATKLKEEIATEEAQREALLKELQNLHQEWLFDRSRLTELQDSQSQLHAEFAEERSLHAAQSRVEKQKILKNYLNYAANSAARLLQAQAALVLREKQQAALLLEAESLTSSFREESLCLYSSHLLLLGALRLNHDKLLYQLRKDAQRRDADVLLKHKTTSNELRETREKALRKMVCSLEEEKNKQISQQQIESKKVLQNTKRFFSDVASASLSLIRQLKNEQAELKRVEARSTKTLEELHAANRSLSEPLNCLQQETAQMQQTLLVYSSEINQITEAKEASRRHDKLFNNLKLQQEVIQQQIIKIKEEKDKMQTKLQEEVLNLQQQKAVENALLEKKADALNEAAEVADAQAEELQWLSSVKNNNLSCLLSSQTLQHLLNAKTEKEEKLKQQIYRVKGLYRNTFNAFLAALHASGFSIEDLSVSFRHFV